ncbi:small ribosomal subunit protein eS7-like [Molossus nigricans]
MFSSSTKIVKPKGETPDSEFKAGISQAPELGLNSDLRAQLRELNITAAKEIEVGGGRKAIIIFVPVPHVVFMAQRRILPTLTRKSRTKTKQKRPRGNLELPFMLRTLTAVQDAVREDLVFPSETVGRRVREKLAGSRLIRVLLDKAQQNVEHKVETFSGVHKKLTGKDVKFEFPETKL